RRPAREDERPPARGGALRGQRPRGASDGALRPVRRPLRGGWARAAVRDRPRDAARRGCTRAPRRAGGPLVLGWRPLALPRPGRTVRMEAGELVGEIEILDPGQGRLASVVAEGPVRAIAVAQDDVRAALEAQPTAAWALLGVLASRFREGA